MPVASEMPRGNCKNAVVGLSSMGKEAAELRQDIFVQLESKLAQQTCSQHGCGTAVAAPWVNLKAVGM